MRAAEVVVGDQALPVRPADARVAKPKQGEKNEEVQPHELLYAEELLSRKNPFNYYLELGCLCAQKSWATLVQLVGMSALAVIAQLQRWLTVAVLSARLQRLKHN